MFTKMKESFELNKGFDRDEKPPDENSDIHYDQVDRNYDQIENELQREIADETDTFHEKYLKNASGQKIQVDTTNIPFFSIDDFKDQSLISRSRRNAEKCSIVFGVDARELVNKLDGIGMYYLTYPDKGRNLREFMGECIKSSMITMTEHDHEVTKLFSHLSDNPVVTHAYERLGGDPSDLSCDCNMNLQYSKLPEAPSNVINPSVKDACLAAQYDTVKWINDNIQSEGLKEMYSDQSRDDNRLDMKEKYTATVKLCGMFVGSTILIIITLLLVTTGVLATLCFGFKMRAISDICPKKDDQLQSDNNDKTHITPSTPIPAPPERLPNINEAVALHLNELPLVSDAIVTSINTSAQNNLRVNEQISIVILIVIGITIIILVILYYLQR